MEAPTATLENQTKERIGLKLVMGQEYEVICKRIAKAGAVFEMSDGENEFVHVSHLASCFVVDPAKFVTVGKTYHAQCIEGKARPLELKILDPDSNKSDSEKKPSRDSDKKDREFRNTRERKDRYIPKQHVPSIVSKPPEYKPVSRNDMSLDQMIHHAQKSFEDKFGGTVSKKNGSRARGRRKTPIDYD